MVLIDTQSLLSSEIIVANVLKSHAFIFEHLGVSRALLFVLYINVVCIVSTSMRVHLLLYNSS